MRNRLTCTIISGTLPFKLVQQLAVAIYQSSVTSQPAAAPRAAPASKPKAKYAKLVQESRP